MYDIPRKRGKYRRQAGHGMKMFKVYLQSECIENLSISLKYVQNMIENMILTSCILRKVVLVVR